MRPLRLFDEESGAVYAVPPAGARFGRHTTAADIVVEERGVSRVHMRVYADDEGAWRVEDLGALNPILLDEESVEGEAELLGPAQLTLGFRALRLPGVPGQRWPEAGVVCVEALRPRELLVVRAHRPELFRLSWTGPEGPRPAGVFERTALGPTWAQVLARSAVEGAEPPAELTRAVEDSLARQGMTGVVDAARVRVGFDGRVLHEDGEDPTPVSRPLQPMFYRRVGRVDLGSFVSSLFRDERDALEEAVEDARMRARL